MKKKILIVLLSVVIYIVSFFAIYKVNYITSDKRQAEVYTEVISTVIVERLNTGYTSYPTDMEYVRTEYQENGIGKKLYYPTIYFQSEDFYKLPDSDKLWFFSVIRSDVEKVDTNINPNFSYITTSCNSSGHGGLHIFSGGDEYVCYTAGGKHGKSTLYKNGVSEYGSFEPAPDNGWQYGRRPSSALLIVFGIGAACVAGITFLTLIQRDKKKKARKLEEEQQKAERERQKQREILLAAMHNHTWSFPAQSLYEKCVEAKITDSSTDFSRKKIQQMAKKILDENRVPETAQEWYINHAAQFFDKGMAAVQGEVNAWKTTLHTADLDEEAAAFLSSASRVKTLYGAQKRQFLLQTKLDALSERHAALTGAKYTPVLEKEKNWATHGGIASGLAGPGAGIATALNTMQENEKIKERNALQREAVSAVNTYFQAHANSVWDQISGVRKELAALPDKIVLDNISTAELLGAYQISVRVIEKISTGNDLQSREKNQRGMWIYFTIRQVRSLNLDIPKSAQIVLDGSIVGKVFTAKEQKHSICPVDAEVAEFAAPLDIYGIPYYNNLSDDQKGRVYEVKALCDHFYGDVNTAYVCRLASKQNLWLMER